MCGKDRAMRWFGTFENNIVNRVGNWGGFLSAIGAAGTIMTGAFAYLVKALKPFQDQGWGWPEAILGGVLLSCFVLLIVSAALIAWRTFRPLPAPPPAPASESTAIEQAREAREEGKKEAPASGVTLKETAHHDRITPALFLSRVIFERNELTNKGLVRIALICFNGSGVELELKRVRGDVGYRRWSEHNRDLERIPTFVTFGDGQTTQTLNRYGEFFMFLEVRASSELTARIASDIEGAGFELNTEKLEIIFTPTDNRDLEIRFPLWESARIGKNAEFVGGWRNRILKAEPIGVQVRATISGRPSEAS